jgi:hypothetical protein
VLVPLAAVPVLSVVPAVVSVDGVSTRVADGSDELKTEHAASRGIMTSTSSTRIEPPLTQTAFTLASGTCRARLETLVLAGVRREERPDACQDYTWRRDSFGRNGSQP